MTFIMCNIYDIMEDRWHNKTVSNLYSDDESGRSLALSLFTLYSGSPYNLCLLAPFSGLIKRERGQLSSRLLLPIVYVLHTLQE